MSRARTNASRFRKKTGKHWDPNLLFDLEAAAQQTLNSPDGPVPKYYIHLSNTNKVGFNYRQEYNTPFGVYAYPLTTETLYLLKTKQLPYLNDAPHLFVLELRDPARCLVINHGCSSSYSLYKEIVYPKDYKGQWALDEEARNEIHKAIRFFADRLDHDMVEKIEKIEYEWQYEPQTALVHVKAWVSVDHPGYMEDIFGSATNGSEDSNLNQRKRLLEAGISSVVDMGTGAIHVNEPAQAVFLTPQSFRTVISSSPGEFRPKPKPVDPSRSKEVKRIEGLMRTIVGAWVGAGLRKGIPCDPHGVILIVAPASWFGGDNFVAFSNYREYGKDGQKTNSNIEFFYRISGVNQHLVAYMHPLSFFLSDKECQILVRRAGSMGVKLEFRRFSPFANYPWWEYYSDGIKQFSIKPLNLISSDESDVEDGIEPEDFMPKRKGKYRKQGKRGRRRALYNPLGE